MISYLVVFMYSPGSAGKLRQTVMKDDLLIKMLRMSAMFLESRSKGPAEKCVA